MRRASMLQPGLLPPTMRIPPAQARGTPVQRPLTSVWPKPQQRGPRVASGSGQRVGSLRSSSASRTTSAAAAPAMIVAEATMVILTDGFTADRARYGGTKSAANMADFQSKVTLGRCGLEVSRLGLGSSYGAP